MNHSSQCFQEMKSQKISSTNKHDFDKLHCSVISGLMIGNIFNSIYTFKIKSLFRYVSLFKKPYPRRYLSPTNRAPAQFFTTIVARLQKIQMQSYKFSRKQTFQDFLIFVMFFCGALPDVRIQVPYFVFCRNKLGTSVQQKPKKSSKFKKHYKFEAIYLHTLSFEELEVETGEGGYEVEKFWLQLLDREKNGSLFDLKFRNGGGNGRLLLFPLWFLQHKIQNLKNLHMMVSFLNSKLELLNYPRSWSSKVALYCKGISINAAKANSVSFSGRGIFLDMISVKFTNCMLQKNTINKNHSFEPFMSIDSLIIPVYCQRLWLECCHQIRASYPTVRLQLQPR